MYNTALKAIDENKTENQPNKRTCTYVVMAL